MKAHVTDIFLGVPNFRDFGGIRIDWSNNRHQRIPIKGKSPDALAKAFEEAANVIRQEDGIGNLEVQP